MEVQVSLDNKFNFTRDKFLSLSRVCLGFANILYNL